MKRFALWTLDGKPNDFPARDYSLFKHGDTDATARLATVCAAWLREHTDAATTTDDVIFPIAYHSVRPAYYYLAEGVVAEINVERGARGLSAARIVRIIKSSVTGNHYAASDAETRRAELRSIAFTLDERVQPGTHVIALDDIRVTGLAEESLLTCLHEAGVRDEDITLGYLAVVDGELAADPSIESRINRAAVGEVSDMLPSITEGHWVLNVRFLKDVLASDDEVIEAFARSAGEAVALEMIEAAYECGSDFVKAHARGIAALERCRCTWSA